ncbi:S9 family peptidase [Pedobacter insulae]|uniref:Acyl-peptide hydrolase n=1 Tax=Pedobacter insulae TaxID=414048 RepID=A0A1I2ZC37_9SPHI|nr:prolyl oligopeptidase family serine peptidase [Pedobacter insulae]SFH34671.1 Dipeptidyl aminopeptidase/acylaminoacyl peptidase [Pedobacter insulae]
MIRRICLYFALFVATICGSHAQTFTVKSVLSYPFPSELTAAAKGSKIAWAMNEQGKRNIYVAEGPSFNPIKITDYNYDDGQELTSLAISDDGKWIVFVRGGDHGSRAGTTPVNAASMPMAPKVQVMTIPFGGGKINVIGEGDNPVISPNSTQLIFTKSGQIMSSPIDGSSPPKNLFYARGSNGSASWSPDGSKIAFVSSRDDHSFIGIYSNAETPIQWLLPSFSRDNSPRWSPDGTEIAFIRNPGIGGSPDPILSRKHTPWAIWRVNIQISVGKQIWKAPQTPQGSIPPVAGGANLLWAADRLVFTSYEDGWPHLYSINLDGSQQTLLTPGDFMVEHVKLSPNKKSLIFSANTGKEKDDIDRRHLYKVSVHKADMQALTAGTGLETLPVFIGDQAHIAYLSATAQQPVLPAVLNEQSKQRVLLAENLVPEEFPGQELVTPTHVTFKAADGGTVYGQLFTPTKGPRKKPAIVYVHGGPQRQMLLGWNHMDYYSIDYALNQYLVSLGYVVLSVNYRLGIGYGYEFHKPLNAGAQGAAEYQDIKAAGEWLANQSRIDADRIGIYGGSYGGYLVALAMGKDSKLFAAGVDIHGVNSRFNDTAERNEIAPDAKLAAERVLLSSPLTYLSTWTSPTLLIHADDDRNVPFSQSVDLARRFENKNFDFEYLAIPDDTHHWMKFSNAVKVSEATANFLHRKLSEKKK